MISKTRRHGKSKQYDEVELNTHLLVEDPVAFVDVCNVAFVLVVPLPRESLLLVDT